MSFYGRLSPRILISRTSDYLDPEIRPDAIGAYEITPDEYIKRSVEVDTSAVVTMDLDEFSSISSIVIKNKSTTSSVVVLVTMITGSQTMVGGDLTASVAGETFTQVLGTDWRLLGAIPGGYLRLSGGNNTGRWGPFYSVSATVLTLAAQETITTGGADAATPLAQIENDLAITLPADSVLMIGGSVRPASGLQMQGVSAACECDVIVTGT